MTLRDNPITTIVFGIILMYFSTESFLRVYDYELTYFSLYVSLHFIEYIGKTLGYDALGIFFFLGSSILLYSGISELLTINKNKISKCPSCNNPIEYEYDFEEIPYSKKCKHCGHKF